MLFNWFNRKKEETVNEIRPYLTKELTWDDEKITAILYNGTQRVMYYKDIIRIDVTAFATYLPVPEWCIQDDNLEDLTTIDFYQDIQADLNELLDMFDKKLENYNTDEVHQRVLEAMLAIIGCFEIWTRNDLDQVLEKIQEAYDPIREALAQEIIEEAELRRANKWWRRLLRWLNPF